MLNLKIKKLNDKAVIPKYAHSGDNGLDLVATSVQSSMDDGVLIFTYGTSVAVEIPEGHTGLLMPRSSIYKKTLILCNSVGLIDSNYRGELMFKFRSTESIAYSRKLYEVGERVGQLVIVPCPTIDLVEVEDFDVITNRGEDGFGSTDGGSNV